MGARPQFPKAAVLSRALRRHHEEILIHTGQHYDDLMSDIFFRDLGLAKPDVNLEVGSGSHAMQTARMLEGIETVLQSRKPDLLIVVGDTNSTIAGALAAAKLQIPVAHVEAGLRSHNRAMPEEINRILTDHISNYLFCPTTTAADCLRKEGIESGIFQVGDVMYDSLLASLELARRTEDSVLKRHGVKSGEYYLATIHRPANTDDPEALERLQRALEGLSLPVLLPLHPRTEAAFAALGLGSGSSLRTTQPVGYLDMLALEVNARAILTDSGGVQREAYFLSIPCVTLREETEWTETLSGDWNILAGTDVSRISAAAIRPTPTIPPPPAFGDGRAAEKIVEILESDPPNSRS